LLPDYIFELDSGQFVESYLRFTLVDCYLFAFRRICDRLIEEVKRSIYMERRPAKAAIAFRLQIGLNLPRNANLAPRVGKEFGNPPGYQWPSLDYAWIRKVEPIWLPGFRKAYLADFHLLNTQQHGYGLGLPDNSMSLPDNNVHRDQSPLLARLVPDSNSRALTKLALDFRLRIPHKAARYRIVPRYFADHRNRILSQLGDRSRENICSRRRFARSSRVLFLRGRKKPGAGECREKEAGKRKPIHFIQNKVETRETRRWLRLNRLHQFGLRHGSVLAKHSGAAQGKPNDEYRAFARLALNIHSAAVRPHNPRNKAETKPQPFFG
jgi:hypothetical protein